MYKAYLSDKYIKCNNNIKSAPNWAHFLQVFRFKSFLVCFFSAFTIPKSELGSFGQKYIKKWYILFQ